MEKIGMKEKASIRNGLYQEIETALNSQNYEVEPVSEGMLVHLENGLFAEVTVTIKNEEKFDLEVARQKYSEKMAAAAERAAKSLKLAEEKAAKAAAKLAKEQGEQE